MAYIADGIGLLGVALVILAYTLLQLGRLEGRSFPYLWMNFWGAGGIVFSLFWQWNLAAFMIEALWMMISLLGLWRAWRKNV